MSMPEAKSLFEHEPPKRIRRAASKSQARMLAVVLVVLTAVIATAAWFLTRGPASYVLGDYKVAKVESGPWTDKLELSAVVELPESRAVTSPEKAPITALLVEEGDSVGKGQTLATLDSSDLVAELSVLQRTRLAREREIEKLDAEYSFSTRKAAADRVALVRTRDEAAKNLTLQEKLAAVGSVSADDVATARLKLTQAEENLAAADLSAEQSATMYQLNRKGSVADLETANESIGELQARIYASTIRSPMAGRILEIASEARESGTILNQYSTIMTVADTTKPVLKAKLPDTETSRVSKGMEVTLVLSSGAVQGTVDRVGVIAYTDSSTYGTYVDLYVKPPTGTELLSGSSASISMDLGKRDQVLQIPRGPWYTGSSQDYVYVVQGDMAVKKQVRLGSSSTRAVEVVSGLDEGDIVITSGYSAFAGYETIELQGVEK